MLPVWSELYGSWRGKASDNCALHKPAFCLSDSHLLAYFIFLWGENRAAWRWGKRESVEFLCLCSCIFFSLVTGAKYEFNSKTGARRWKDSLPEMPEWRESAPRGAALSRAVSEEGTRPLRSTRKERDGLSGQAQAEAADPGSRSRDGKPGTPKNRNAAFLSKSSPKLHSGI